MGQPQQTAARQGRAQQNVGLALTLRGIDATHTTTTTTVSEQQSPGVLRSRRRECTKGPRVWSESMPTNGTISVLAPAADDMRIPITLHQQMI
jgi:hypothetical protein